MERSRRWLDLSIIAFLVPYVAAAVYWLITIFWMEVVDPQKAFLTVTRDPMIFLLGIISTVIAILLYASGLPPERKATSPEEVSSVLAYLGLISAVSAYVVAVSSGGGLVQGIVLMVAGRFSSIYPSLLFFMAFLLRVKPVTMVKVKTAIGLIVLLLAIPTYFFTVRLVGSPMFGIFSALAVLISLAIIAERFLLGG